MQYTDCLACGGAGKVPTPQSLREARLAKGLRLADISAKAGVGLSYLSDIENGRRAAPYRVIKVYQEL